MRQVTSIVFLLAAINIAPLIYSQTFLEGTVQDPQGRAIDGATLTLFRDHGSAPLAATRSKAGAFRFSLGAGAAYIVEASAPGFSTLSMPVTDGAALNIKLKLAAVDQQVVVTAEAAAQTVDHISKAVTIIDSQEIAQRNEYSLSETLRNTPGLLVRNLGGPGQFTTVRMRGLRADATSVLIDGLRFRDVASIQGDASGFVSTLNIVNLDRIEVLHGSGSSLYGSNAVGGTINLVTPQGGGPVHGDLQLEGGMLGLIRARTSVAGGVRDNRFVYSLGLLHLNVTGGVDGNDRARSSGLQGFAKYSFKPTLTLSTRLFVSDDFVQPNSSPTTSGIPAANIPNTTIVAAVPFSNGVGTFIPNRDDPDYRRASRFWSTALVLRQALGATADWQASYQKVHTNRTFADGPGGFGFQPIVSNFSQFEGGIDTVAARLNLRPRSWDAFSAGAEYEREKYFNADDNRRPAPATLSTETNAGQRSHAYYFANQVMLLQQRLQISASGRAQFFNLDRPNFVYKGTANPYQSLSFNSAPKALTGDIAASYFVAKSGTKLRAHFGNSYRAPGLYERFGSGFYTSGPLNAVVFSPYGNPGLSPDRYNGFDTGVDQYLWRDKIRLSGTWFYTRIARITQFDFSYTVVRPDTDIFGRSSGYFNGSGGISRGAETTVEVRPRRSTLLRTSYTYVNAGTDQDTAVRGFYRALSIPRHTFSAMLNQQLGKRTSVTVDLYHSSDYYNALFAAGRSRAYQYPGLTKIDLVGNRVLWQGEKLSLNGYAKVDNLLNQTFYENGFRSAGGTFLSGLRVMFR